MVKQMHIGLIYLQELRFKFIHKKIPNINIGKLPIMLKSKTCVLKQYEHFENTQTGECKYDCGGYFIINGSEKTVLAQERAAENKVYCFNINKNITFPWVTVFCKDMLTTHF